MGQGPSTHQDQFGCHSPRSGNSAWPQPPSSCQRQKTTCMNPALLAPEGHCHSSSGQGHSYLLPPKCGQQLRRGKKPRCTPKAASTSTSSIAQHQLMWIYQAESREAPPEKQKGQKICLGIAGKGKKDRYRRAQCHTGAYVGAG